MDGRHRFGVFFLFHQIINDPRLSGMLDPRFIVSRSPTPNFLLFFVFGCENGHDQRGFDYIGSVNSGRPVTIWNPLALNCIKWGPCPAFSCWPVCFPSDVNVRKEPGCIWNSRNEVSYRTIKISKRERKKNISIIFEGWAKVAKQLFLFGRKCRWKVVIITQVLNPQWRMASKWKAHTIVKTDRVTVVIALPLRQRFFFVFSSFLLTSSQAPPFFTARRLFDWMA